MNFFDEPTRFDTLTESEVISWWNPGAETVDDIRHTGNAAIRRHHEQLEHAQLTADLATVAEEPGRTTSGIVTPGSLRSAAG